MKIWDDPWLPGKNDFYVHSPCLKGWEDLTINGPLHENGQGWNEELVNGLLDEEADIILSIPLDVNCREDKVIWSLTENGKFLIKFAYQIFMGTYTPPG